MELVDHACSRPGIAETPLAAATLREAGIFGALSDEVLAVFAQTLATERFAAGDVIFSEGDAAHCLYVLLEGEVEVLKRSRHARDHRVAILGPSDCFGEMSIVDMQARSATVRAISPSRVVRVSSEDFDRLYRQDVRSYALVALNIARDLSRRLRVADAILAEVAGSVMDRYAKPPA
jgi:CRP-like cAMP-binding protein